MRVLYLVFNEGYSGDVDLAAEAIRLTRHLASLVEEPEVDGLLALMLLPHARRASRTRAAGSIVVPAEQDLSPLVTQVIAAGDIERPSAWEPAGATRVVAVVAISYRKKK